MRLIFLLVMAICAVAADTAAQDFITRGKIEYEVKLNNRRRYAEQNMGNSSQVEEFVTSYRQLIFSGTQWLYCHAINGKPKAEGPSVYINFDERMATAKKEFGDGFYLCRDSVVKVRWKIENETRKIAGFECRKAVGRIFDSVYVVAFYCPEIIPQGGPELFTGLPGMILGLAIPRYYTTWFATKLEIATVDESAIVPPVVKKGKTYTLKELKDELQKVYGTQYWWSQFAQYRLAQYIGGYLL